MNINSAIIGGRVTRDPELKYSQGGMAITTLSIAVNAWVKGKGEGGGKEQVSFFDVVCFGKTAENSAQHLTKGQEVVVEGYLQQDRWQDQDGATKTKVKIIANRVHFGSKSRGGRGGGGGDDGDEAPAKPAGKRTAQEEAAPDFGGSADVPF